MLTLAIDIGSPEQLDIEGHFLSEVKWLCDSSVNSRFLRDLELSCRLYCRLNLVVHRS